MKKNLIAITLYNPSENKILKKILSHGICFSEIEIIKKKKFFFLDLYFSYASVNKKIIFFDFPLIFLLIPKYNKKVIFICLELWGFDIKIDTIKSYLRKFLLIIFTFLSIYFSDITIVSSKGRKRIMSKLYSKLVNKRMSDIRIFINA